MGPLLRLMAPWLLLLLPWSAVALDMRESSRKATERGDIMKAIINQVAVSMQRDMGEKIKAETPEETELTDLPKAKSQESPQVGMDSWVRIIKKEMERIGLIPPSFANEHKRAMRIMKKARWSNRSTDLERLKRSFWMWERSLNRSPQMKPAWFVLPSSEEQVVKEKGAEKDNVGLVRDERDVKNEVVEENAMEGKAREEKGAPSFNPMKSFWKWERALNRPKLANAAWFVVDGDNKESSERNKSESKRGNAVSKFQRWDNSLQQSLAI